MVPVSFAFSQSFCAFLMMCFGKKSKVSFRKHFVFTQHCSEHTYESVRATYESFEELVNMRNSLQNKENLFGDIILQYTAFYLR